MKLVKFNIRRAAILFACVLAGGLAIGLVDLLIMWASSR
jgi:hypothetical protein